MRFTVEDKGPVVGLADVAQELYPLDGFYEDMPADVNPAGFCRDSFWLEPDTIIAPITSQTDFVSAPPV